MDEYERFMAEAVAEGKRGKFKTCPNPAVGAVLIRDGRVVARGWHKGAGQPHAEIECLADAARQGIDPRGAAMAVTLEPCRHYGKTPPCVDALLDAGISSLIYGSRDPNPEASGGAALLGEDGVKIIGPVLEQECKDLLADFTVWQTESRPYVVLKLASTLDGRIATRGGHSRWISNDQSRHAVHCMRSAIASAGGAILIGGSTFYNDNPALTARGCGGKPERQPLACVMTSRLPRPEADFHLLRERPEETIFFASPAAAASTKAEALRGIGCRVYAIGPVRPGVPDFGLMLNILRQELNCFYVLCEGGGRLALSLLDEGLIDEFHLHVAPMILGDNEARPLFNGRSPLTLDEALRMRFCGAAIVSGDAHLLLRPLGRKAD